MIDLKDINIILTGATGGIGNSILENLILSGANVLATGTNEEKLNLIKKKYKNVQIEKFDISNHLEIENFINVVKKMLKSKKGKIINITSIVGHTGNIGQANYTASKAGVVAMSKSLALEYGKKNINVNCISPGFISTEMTDKVNEDYKEVLKSKIPMNRFGTPNDIANTVIFLCSKLSDYITGETIHVNGGMYFS